MDNIELVEECMLFPFVLIAAIDQQLRRCSRL